MPDEQNAPEGFTEAKLQEYESYVKRCKMLDESMALRIIGVLREIQHEVEKQTALMPEHVPPTDDELKQWADWLSDENFIVTPSRLNLLRLIAEVRRLWEVERDTARRCTQIAGCSRTMSLHQEWAIEQGRKLASYGDTEQAQRIAVALLRAKADQAERCATLCYHHSGEHYFDPQQIEASLHEDAYQFRREAEELENAQAKA
jgi:hypothetical protein